MTASILDLNLFHLGHLEPAAVFKEKHGIMRPYAGADCNLTLSHNRLQSRALNPNVEKCRRRFPQLFKNGTTSRKIESTRKGDGADLMSWNRHFMERQPHA